MACLCFVVATGIYIVSYLRSKLKCITGGKDVKIKGKGGSLTSLQEGDVDPATYFPNKLYLITKQYSMSFDV